MEFNFKGLPQLLSRFPNDETARQYLELKMATKKKNHIRKKKTNGIKKGKYHEVIKVDATFTKLMNMATKTLKKIK